MRRRSCESSDVVFLEQLVRLRRVQPELLLKVQDAIIEVEDKIALVERSCPLNYLEEVERLTLLLEEGDYQPPTFRYAAVPRRLVRLKSEIEAIRVALGSYAKSPLWGVTAELLDEKVQELSLDLGLVLDRESPCFDQLLFERFPVTVFESRATELAHRWLDENVGTVESSSEVSLASYLNTKIIEHGYGFSLIERKIASVAAVTHEGLVVSAGSRVSESEAERIWVHEVHGHLMPRSRGEHSLAPLGCGTRFALESEEGRAVLLEERHGFLSKARRQTLAVRHLIAAQRRTQAGKLENLVLELRRRGVEAKMLGRIVCRVLRGGGLAREACYLTCYLQLKEHLKKFPEDELWMKWGRVAPEASRRLTHLLSENSTTQGA